jgi:cell wall-associated NlpC family hydrolase
LVEFALDSCRPIDQHAGMRTRLLISALLVLLLVGCGGGNQKRADVRPADPELANAVLFRAIGLVGTPYRFGGNTPEGGFDCSGLVGFVYRDAASVTLPRSSKAIAEVRAPKLDRERLAPGDLVFFGAKGRVNHVGIYVGEKRFVHAPNRGGTVRLDELNGHYWRDAWMFGKRVLR